MRTVLYLISSLTKIFLRFQIHLLRKVLLLAQKNMNYNRNPQGKGLPQKFNIEDKDKILVKEIGNFNLMLFNKYNGKPDSPEELADRFSDYFQLCLEYNQIPTVEGLAMISGYARSSFFDISQGTFKPEFTDIVKKAKDYIAFFDAGLAVKGKIPAPTYIFRSKNFYGMKDTQDVQITPNVNPNIPEDAEEIIKKLPEKS